MTPLQASRALRDLVKMPAQIAAAVAKRINTDIQVNFSGGKDPYKRKWPGLAKSTIAKGRHNPPLTDTRALRNNTTAKPMQGAGIRITSDTTYGVYHMRKTDNRPARKFLPENVLPELWFKIYQEELDKQANKTLAGMK